MATSTLFLDFDGVLHSMSGYRDEPFCRLPLLEEVLINTDVDIVISSSWRFQYSLEELKDRLGQLGPKVVATTGDPHVGSYPRFNEILKYAETHQISNWRALDDASYEFPSTEMRVFVCNPNVGVEDFQLMQLAQWIRRSA